MYHFKMKMLVILGVAIAVNGVTASAASAGAWFVAGTKLAKGATVALANTAQVDESTTLNAPSLGMKITCSGSIGDGKGQYFQGEASFGAESVTFLGCSEISPSTCTIQTSITTEPVVGSIETGTAPLDRVRIAPKTGQTFASINVSGSCVEAGEQGIIGRYVADSKTGQEEGVTGTAEALGTTENNSLEILEKKAYFQSGKTLLRSVVGLAWSFH